MRADRGHDTDSAAAHPGRRAGVLVTLVAAMIAGTSLQYAAPVLAPFVLPDLGLSRTQLGALTTTFYLVGAVTSPAAGRWCDRTGGRKALVTTFLVGAAAFVGMGLAPTYLALVASAAVGGLAAATSNPATNRLVLSSFPPRRRGAVVGVKQSGVQMGAMLAGAALPPIATVGGWRPALVLSGLVVLAGVLLTWAYIPADADRQATRGRDVLGTERNPTVTTLAAFAALMGLGIASVATYLPVFAVERVGLSATGAGLVTAVMAGLGVGSRVLWGMAADRIARPLAVLPGLAGGALLGVALVAMAPTVGSWSLWAGAGVFGATAMGWNGVAMLAAMTAVSRERAGWASGRVILFFYVGLVASPVPFGMLADATGSYSAGWAGVTVAFAAATAVSAASSRRTRRRAHVGTSPV